MGNEKPTLDLAYQLAVASYEPLVKRLDALDARLQTVMGLAATTMALVSSVASARNLSFHSPWFWLATCAFALIIFLGNHVRHYGDIILINPKRINTTEWMELEPEWFKQYIIKQAGDHWEKNNALVLFKWRRSVEISYVYLLQVGLLVVWVAAAGL